MVSRNWGGAGTETSRAEMAELPVTFISNWREKRMSSDAPTATAFRVQNADLESRNPQADHQALAGQDAAVVREVRDRFHRDPVDGVEVIGSGEASALDRSARSREQVGSVTHESLVSVDLLDLDGAVRDHRQLIEKEGAAGRVLQLGAVQDVDCALVLVDDAGHAFDHALAQARQGKVFRRMHDATDP